MTVRQVLSAFRIRFDPEENKNLTEERGFFMKNLIVGQSGGPTAVINSSLYGVIQEGLAHSEEIGHVYGMINGIQGFLKGKYMDLAELDSQTLTALRTTPGAYLGSCRYKLPENLSDPVYAELFWKFEELSIGYFLYIGGNDSMDTVSKLSRAAEIHKSSIRFIGVPKTIDNDLILTDHTPGFGSAAKYVAAGWLTAAAALSRKFEGDNPILIYLPEVAFDQEDFIRRIEKAFETKNSLIVCVSEGIHDAEGKFICEYTGSAGTDTFGHKMLTGCGKYLENLVRERLGIKVRSVELNLCQRCSIFSQSLTDAREAALAGSSAVEAALKGESGKMVSFVRTSDEPYELTCSLEDVNSICNQEKKVPLEWITKDGTDVSEEFLTYARPLIQGNPAIPMKNGLPDYAYRR